MDKGIDIIIPIYNAYDDLQICLDSIYKHTDLNKNRLILINDNSPDERIRYYLDNQQGENVIVIHNESNQGFSNNINLGMEQSEESDVILLNSDTVVTKNWVEKMVECAYSDMSIGTVTPLSNNATLCSVPNFCEENVLPEGMSIDKAAEIVEECSLRKYPRITVAHGFCMLVKREVINTIGNFDAETFGRGYGEENDFCNRAEQMGYIHVMCDDTYIYHSGTKSFVSKEKEEYIKEHEKILYKRYPVQMQKNEKYCHDNPNRWVGKNIEYHFDIWNGKKNILFLLHSDFKEGADDNVGGTQLHVKQLTMQLRKSMNVFVAARNRDFLQVTAYTSNTEHSFQFYIGEREQLYAFRDRKLAKIFNALLMGFRIDLVHVHQTSTTSLDIYYEANKLGIPILYTVHDFYYICPCTKMLDANGRVCIGQKMINCRECLHKKYGIYEKNEYLSIWRRKHREALMMCNVIIAPSESAQNILSSYYAAIKEKIKVIGHGMDMPKLLEVDESKVNITDSLIWEIENVDKNARCPIITGIAYFAGEKDMQYKVVLKITDEKRKTILLPTNFDNVHNIMTNKNKFYAHIPNAILTSGDLKLNLLLIKNGEAYENKKREQVIKEVSFQSKAKFRVAFVGGINEEKGGKIISNIVKKGSNEVEWYVIGGIGENSLECIKKDNLIKTGYYYQEDLATYLKYHKIDAVCILSKWPETFSYTLSEALINHIPVIVTDIGALGARVRNSGCGEVVSADERRAADEVIEKIDKWRLEGSDYQSIKSIVEGYRHETLLQMTGKYEYVYTKLFEIENKNRKSAVSRECLEFLYNAYTEGIDSDKGNFEFLNKISAIENEINLIRNNVTIQFMLRLTKIQFPFKQQIRQFCLKRIKKKRIR